MFKRSLILSCLIFIGLMFANSSFSAFDGLVGAWTFDEDAGKNVTDMSKNGHNGELVGNAKIEKVGKYGSAVSCDGTEAYVMIPDSDDFEFDGDFSIACWFKGDQPPADHSSFVTKGYHRPAANGGDAKPWYLMYYLKTGTVDFFLRDTKAVNSRAVGKTMVMDGKWHHVVGTKEGNKVKIYIDGKEDGSADAVDAKYGQNDQPLVFMVHFDRWVKGMIDEVAIFKKAINVKEINLIMDGISKNVLSVSQKYKLAVTWGGLKLE